jgi:hypothetical protein
MVNLDHHSDMGGLMECTVDCESDLRRLELHSGSWADYVEWPVKSEFVWAYPHPGCLEHCRCDPFSVDVNRIRLGLPFDDAPDELPFTQIPQRAEHNWQSLRCYLARPAHYGIAMEKVRAANITLSPDCCGIDAVDAFKTLVAEFGLELIDLLLTDLGSLKATLDWNPNWVHAASR